MSEVKLSERIKSYVDLFNDARAKNLAAEPEASPERDETEWLETRRFNDCAGLLIDNAGAICAALRLAESPSAAEAVKREREACAKIAEGEVVFEHYRRWPCWQPHGDRSKEWEGTQLADAIAAAIRKGPPDPRDATIASQRALLEKAAEGLDEVIAPHEARNIKYGGCYCRGCTQRRALVRRARALRDEIAAALGKGGKGEWG